MLLLKQVPCAVIGKFPAPSTRNAASSSSFREILRERNTPLAKAYTSTFNSILGSCGLFSFPSPFVTPAKTIHLQDIHVFCSEIGQRALRELVRRRRWKQTTLCGIVRAKSCAHRARQKNSRADYHHFRFPRDKPPGPSERSPRNGLGDNELSRAGDDPVGAAEAQVFESEGLHFGRVQHVPAVHH